MRQTILDDNHRRIRWMTPHCFCGFAFDIIEVFLSSVSTQKYQDHADNEGENNGDGDEEGGEEQHTFGGAQGIQLKESLFAIQTGIVEETSIGLVVTDEQIELN